MLDVLDHFNLEQIQSFFGLICNVIKVKRSVKSLPVSWITLLMPAYTGHLHAHADMAAD